VELERRREIERRLGFRFMDATLLEFALTHSSAKTEKRPSNERLEFLGDAVLGLVISDFLYTAFPDRDEGELTRIKSVVVSAKTLAQEAKRLELDQVLDVGRGVQKDGIPASIIANVFEAVIGAIYLDGGLEPARRFILNKLATAIEGVVRARHSLNWKSLLQQLTQRLWAETPTYEVAREIGPEHGKEFEVVALVKSEVKGAGRGRSKKLAEQSAARAALESLLGGAASSLDAEGLEKLAEAAQLASNTPPPDDPGGAT
jgi:ribonuclease-3